MHFTALFFPCHYSNASELELPQHFSAQHKSLQYYLTERLSELASKYATYSVSKLGAAYETGEGEFRPETSGRR